MSGPGADLPLVFAAPRRVGDYKLFWMQSHRRLATGEVRCLHFPAYESLLLKGFSQQERQRLQHATAPVLDAFVAANP